MEVIHLTLNIQPMCTMQHAYLTAQHALAY